MVRVQQMHKSDKMKKLQLGMMVFISMFFAGFSSAQSVADGKSFLYYERYKSAKDVFKSEAKRS